LEKDCKPSIPSFFCNIGLSLKQTIKEPVKCIHECASRALNWTAGAHLQRSGLNLLLSSAPCPLIHLFDLRIIFKGNPYVIRVWIIFGFPEAFDPECTDLREDRRPKNSAENTRFSVPRTFFIADWCEKSIHDHEKRRGASLGKRIFFKNSESSIEGSFGQC
jgi:hypothetical protein